MTHDNDEETITEFPTEPAPPSDEMDGFADAHTRALTALLDRIATAANDPQHTSFEAHNLLQLAKSYRVVAKWNADAVSKTVTSSTLEDATANHVAALEHFYDCVRFDCGLPPRLGPVSHEDVVQCLDASRAKFNAVNAELLGANLQIDDYHKFYDGVRRALGLTPIHRDERPLSEQTRVVLSALNNRLDSSQQELGRLRRSSNDVFHASQDGAVTDLGCRIQGRVAALAKSDNAINDLLDRDHVPKAATTAERVANEYERFQGELRKTNEALAESANSAGIIANLRNELQAANEEVAGMRAESASYVMLLNDVTAMLERSFKKIFGDNAKLDPWRDERTAVRSLFPGITSESKDEHAKRRALFHAIELHALRLNDVLNALDSFAPGNGKPFERVRSLANNLNAAREKISAMVDLLGGKGTGLDDPDLLMLADLIGQEAEQRADLASINALLNSATKWTPYAFVVDSQDRRIDVIRSLAARAEALHRVQDALATTDLDPTLHPNFAVRRLIDQRNDAREDAATIAKERDSLRAAILDVQTALSGVPFDPSKTPGTGKLTDIVETIKSLISAFRSARGALQVANDHLRVSDENLRRALILSPQGKAIADMTDLMQQLVELIAFWRRGAEPFRQAAAALEAPIKKVLGESYAAFIGKVDVLGEVTPIEVNEVFGTLHKNINDAVARRNMPNIFDCGCSRLKVSLGKCDIYDEFGKERTGLTDEFKATVRAEIDESKDG